MLTIWAVTVWDGDNEIDHVYFNARESQHDVIQYMLERVYGAKQYKFAKDVKDGSDVLVDYIKGNGGKVEIYCTNLLPDISIARKRMTAVLDLGYTPHKMNLIEKVENGKAKKLWAELGDIPTNEDDEIDEDWHLFTKGTPREDIWHWFEETFDLSVATDLMGM